MSLLHNVTGSSLIRFIQSRGYVCERQNGSHKIFINQKYKTIIVPVYKKKIVKTGLLCEILKDIGISKIEFIHSIQNHYKKEKTMAGLVNAPSKTGNPSGSGRGNNPPSKR